MSRAFGSKTDLRPVVARTVDGKVLRAYPVSLLVDTTP